MSTLSFSFSYKNVISEQKDWVVLLDLFIAILIDRFAQSDFMKFFLKLKEDKSLKLNRSGIKFSRV